MKKSISLLLSIMMVLMCVATAVPAMAEEELAKDVTVRVYSWWDPAKPGMINLKAGFEAKYADYGTKLEFVKISDYYKTMLTKLAGLRLAGGKGEDIDVMMIAFDKIPQFASNNALTNLDEYASQEYLDSLYPSVRDGLFFDGHLYATARDVTTTCMVLNTAMFKQYGIELPTEDWTMEQFIDICKQFGKNEGVWGYAIDGNSDTLYPWMYLYGAQFFDPQTDMSLLDQPAQMEGITALYNLIEEGGCMSVAQVNEFGDGSSAMASGHVAMLSGGLWLANEVSTKMEDFMVLPLPTGVSGEKQSHTFPNCWAVPTVSTQPAWGWKVIEYFSSVEGQTIACNAEMGLPATPAADISAWLEAKPWRKYYADALGYPKTQPYQVDTFAPAWGNYFKSLFTEKIWDVRGLDAETLKTTVQTLNGQLSYYLLGGS
ncbi:MAG: extracellular solute-binding protein [Clostridia bacterium]